MKIIYYIVGVLIISSFVGCGMLDRSFEREEDRNGQRFVSNRETNWEGYEDEGKYYQNPNLLHFPERTAVNNDDDVEMAADIVVQAGYEPDSIWINGNTMWVKATATQTYGHEKRLKEEAKLRKKLLNALPRYQFEVKIVEGG
ncbi:MAG: hypothetical protein H0Z31_00700 [Bacillus sp. (in: Bacteria)]|nr:hypothetical protein [Bacillus sp. (in: firmicutes)]